MMIDSRIPSEVRRDVLEPRGIRSAVAVGIGMSGGEVFRCEAFAEEDTQTETWALKRWPESTSAQRAGEVHQVWRAALCGESVRGESLIVPELAWAGTSAGHVWDLSQWMPGQPLDRDADLDQIRAGAEAIGRFHAAVSGLGVGLQAPPAATARIERLEQLVSLGPILSSSKPSPVSPPVGDAIDRARLVIGPAWRSIRGRLLDRMRFWAGQPVRVQYVLRDVHRQHILFDEGRVTGMIDFDAIRMDAVATDLARWAGGFLAVEPGPFQADSQVDLMDTTGACQARIEGVWAAGLAGLRAGQSFQTQANGRSRNEPELDADQTLAFARDLHQATTWISLANWLDWILVQRRTFAAGDASVADRIDELTRLARLDL